MQTAAMTERQHILQDLTGTVRSVNSYKALIHMRTDDFIKPCPVTLRSRDPGVKTASRDTEHLA